MIKARCALRRMAACCANEVNVVFGLDRELDSVSNSEAAERGSHAALSAAGLAGWKYR